MAITEIQISGELETNAPSIRYRGNEGPKSPQEIEMMMASVDEPFSGGQPLPQDPTKPVNPFAPKPTGPVLPDKMMAGDDTPEIEIELLEELLEAFREKFGRDPVSIDELKRAIGQMREGAAYGGIMGLDGRRKYGLGSSLKKFARKIIPNEVAEIAVKAAPFVAPFNPLAAAAMSGIGSFDQTGRIGSSLKSGLMNYALGQGARYLGGADFQRGINPFRGMKGMRFGLSSPTGEGGIKNLFKDKASVPIKSSDGTYKMSTFTEDFAPSGETGNKLFKPTSTYDAIKEDQLIFKPEKLASKTPLGSLKSKIMEYVPTSLGQLNPLGQDFDIKKLVGTFGIFKTAEAILGSPEKVVSSIIDRGEGMDVASIRAEVQEAFQDETGQKLKDLQVKYPYLGRMDTKDFAMGGRIGRAEGGLMDLGGFEKDYRAEGGFVPIGKEEKADDVPARLSVNEFVFTADAVRNAGGGDIDKGAEVMENMMKHLEAGGQVSEESQGMAGAQRMFEVSERLSEVV